MGAGMGEDVGKDEEIHEGTAGAPFLMHPACNKASHPTYATWRKH